jgi:hypothetical protein
MADHKMTCSTRQRSSNVAEITMLNNKFPVKIQQQDKTDSKPPLWYNSECLGGLGRDFNISMLEMQISIKEST